MAARRALGALLALALLLSAPAGAAGAKTRLPDLIIDPWYFYCCGMIDTVTTTFAPDDCAVQEGYVPAGTHRLLRFPTVVANVGNADLVLGRPRANDPDWFYSACHDHWHFVPFAEYRLFDATGAEVGIGHKQTFCVMDGNPYDSRLKVPRQQFVDCDRQGLSYNWEDAYWHYFTGQWIVIDDLPAGRYALSIEANYAGALPESNYSNNTATVGVTIP